MGYAKAQLNNVVVEATQKAYQVLLPFVKSDATVPITTVMKAMEPLLEMRGVGPATASAILSAMHPSIPFMSDEALEVCLSGKRQYTVTAYKRVITALHEKLESIETQRQARTAPHHPPSPSHPATDVVNTTCDASSPHLTIKDMEACIFVCYTTKLNDSHDTK